MADCIIFCAAEFDALIKPVAPDDYIIAADGGLKHTEKLGIVPREVIGDFDSLGYVPQGANVFPVEKDDTDAMLAVRRGLLQGYRSFLIYGGMDGPRLDHTMANFQMLHFLAEQNAFGCLVGKNTLAAVVCNGEIHFPYNLDGNISVFCLGADAENVTLQGLYYPLEKASLCPSFPLGVSNHFTGQSASVKVEKGALLLLWDRACGLPVDVRQYNRETK
ncbi:MAG: thiamine diphosphokinase [Oscillospiraceae bacterium]|nr:thiamine diphosphokinase [Oscillospiraceae bacterium]